MRLVNFSPQTESLQQIEWWLLLVLHHLLDLSNNLLLVFISSNKRSIREAFELHQKCPNKVLDSGRELRKLSQIEFPDVNYLQLKRLFDMIEVESPSLAFSGKQFFYITRGLILGVIDFRSLCWCFRPFLTILLTFQMAGTIVTFEILLLDEVDSHKEELCHVIDY